MRQQLRDQILSYVQIAKKAKKKPKKVALKRVKKAKPTVIDEAALKKADEAVFKHLAMRGSEVQVKQIILDDEMANGYNNGLLMVSVSFDSFYHLGMDELKKATLELNKVLGRQYKFVSLDIGDKQAVLNFKS